MKYLITLCILFFGLGAQAVPVLNESVANTKDLVIFPDHKDPDLFYIGPNFMSLVFNETGTPLFSYTEYKKGFKRIGVIQSVLKAQYHEDTRAEAMADVRKWRPNARFANLPFHHSEMDFNHPIKDLIYEQACSQVAGQIGDETTCSFSFTPTGVKFFRAQMSGHLTIALNFIYQVKGCEKELDVCQPAILTHSVAARITSDQLRDHPQLFLNSRGRTIKFKRKK